MDRRALLTALALMAAAPATAQPRRRAPTFDPALAAIERKYGGRLGVFALDTATRKTMMWREDERFTMCSTFKALLAALVLVRVDAGEENLSRTLSFGPGDLIEGSPVTTRHADTRALSIRELAKAAVQVSDNTAANLLLRAMGGPESLTRFARSLGDDATRADRYEPDCNLRDPLLDTTTPRAMATTLRRLFQGPLLHPGSRRLLEDWMIASPTGENRLRAGLPRGWVAGDKTGSSTAFSNDIAFVRPPGRRPLFIAAYYDAPRVSFSAREAALREAGAAFAAWARASG